MAAPPRKTAVAAALPTRDDVLVSLIQGIREAINQQSERLSQHEQRDDQRDDVATQHRHDLRAELILQNKGLREEQAAQTKDLAGRLDRLQGSTDAKLAALDSKFASLIDALASKNEAAAAVLHGRVTDNRVKGLMTIIKALIIVSALMGSGLIYLLVKQLGL